MAMQDGDLLAMSFGFIALAGLSSIEYVSPP